jgi:hypothetical protein
MKKIFVSFLAMLPLIAVAQSQRAVPQGEVIPIVLCFNESSTYKDFVVPPKMILYISRIYSESESMKLKLSVEGDVDVKQQKFTQCMTFSRAEFGNFSQNGIYLPERSRIEYDGTPLLIFCWLENTEPKK